MNKWKWLLSLSIFQQNVCIFIFNVKYSKVWLKFYAGPFVNKVEFTIEITYSVTNSWFHPVVTAEMIEKHKYLTQVLTVKLYYHLSSITFCILYLSVFQIPKTKQCNNIQLTIKNINKKKQDKITLFLSLIFIYHKLIKYIMTGSKHTSLTYFMKLFSTQTIGHAKPGGQLYFSEIM